MRKFGDWEAWAAVGQDNGGPYMPTIYVRNPALGIQRDNPCTGFRHGSAQEAEEFAIRTLDEVTGVNSDGTLKFR